MGLFIRLSMTGLGVLKSWDPGIDPEPSSLPETQVSKHHGGDSERLDVPQVFLREHSAQDVGSEEVQEEPLQ